MSPALVVLMLLLDVTCELDFSVLFVGNSIAKLVWVILSVLADEIIEDVDCVVVDYDDKFHHKFNLVKSTLYFNIEKSIFLYFPQGKF